MRRSHRVSGWFIVSSVIAAVIPAAVVAWTVVGFVRANQLTSIEVEGLVTSVNVRVGISTWASVAGVVLLLALVGETRPSGRDRRARLARLSIVGGASCLAAVYAHVVITNDIARLRADPNSFAGSAMVGVLLIIGAGLLICSVAIGMASWVSARRRRTDAAHRAGTRTAA